MVHESFSLQINVAGLSDDCPSPFKVSVIDSLRLPLRIVVPASTLYPLLTSVVIEYVIVALAHDSSP